MDIGTQGLASLVVARALVPRAGWRAWGVIVAAGTIANIDFFTSMMSPEIYVEWHRTYSHSIIVSVIFGAVLAAAYQFVTRDGFGDGPNEKTPAGTPFSRQGKPALRKVPRGAFFAAVIFAGLLHLALDAAQTNGTMIFWPASRQRVALDWLPRVDPWIIATLLAALLLPELTRLVTDEIGARSKRPGGRIGAILGIVVLALYIGVRADLHSNATATLRNRNYDTGLAHRVAAYPDTGSPFAWHGIVDTERALYQLDASIFTSSQFDSDVALTTFKPELSPTLAAAQQTAAAKTFLATAQFPKAEVDQTTDGRRVFIRDLRYAATGEPRQIEARIDFDANGKILNDELAWAPKSEQR